MQPIEIIKAIEETAPLHAAASWDVSGLQVAAHRQNVAKLAVCLDPTPASVGAALEQGGAIADRQRLQQGWQARAPLDAIIVTAAPPEIPAALLAQLDDGGVLVLPVGEEHQFLKRIRRRGNEFVIDTVEAVRFVPLVKGELA